LVEKESSKFRFLEEINKASPIFMIFVTCYNLAFFMSFSLSSFLLLTLTDHTLLFISRIPLIFIGVMFVSCYLEFSIWLFNKSEEVRVDKKCEKQFFNRYTISMGLLIILTQVVFGLIFEAPLAAAALIIITIWRLKFAEGLISFASLKLLGTFYVFAWCSIIGIAGVATIEQKWQMNSVPDHIIEIESKIERVRLIGRFSEGVLYIKQGELVFTSVDKVDQIKLLK
jgi:hypothetical protein